MKTRYVAYDDASVYALGATPEEAVAMARHQAKEPNAVFSTARVSEGLAAFIEEHGWDLSRSFTVVGTVLGDELIDVTSR